MPNYPDSYAVSRIHSCIHSYIHSFIPPRGLTSTKYLLPHLLDHPASTLSPSQLPPQAPSHAMRPVIPHLRSCYAIPAGNPYSCSRCCPFRVCTCPGAPILGPAGAPIGPALDLQSHFQLVLPARHLCHHFFLFIIFLRGSNCKLVPSMHSMIAQYVVFCNYFS